MKRFASLIIASLLSASFGAHAAAPPVVELFGCNFLEGKGMADLDKVIAVYKSALPKINSPELQKMGSNIWVPYRGTMVYDFVWANHSMTLDEWGKASLAYDSSKEGQAADAAFFAVAKCPASGVVTQEVLYRSEQPLQQDDEVLLESYACALNPGKSMADVDAAIAVWKPVFARHATGASLVTRRVPVIAGGPTDLFYLAVWDDVAAFASATSSFMEDSGSSASNDALNAAHSCTGGLWKAHSIVAPAQR